jgi:Fe-S-cluster containining protein
MSASIDLARIREVQEKARQGKHGQWRKEYSRRYRQLLESIYEEMRSEVLRYTASGGESIQCQKGCHHCCEHFISVPVSHAIVVTDYLYASEKAMSVFLRSYPIWRRSIEENPQAVDVFSILEEDTARAAEVKPSPQELLSAYHNLNIPCPFLDGKCCAIYPVRPLCCAAYFSVSLPEFCSSDSVTQAVLLQITPSRSNLRKLSELTDPRLSLHQDSLPRLVYKLLTDGLPEVAIETGKLFDSQRQNTTQA